MKSRLWLYGLVAVVVAVAIAVPESYAMAAAVPQLTDPHVLFSGVPQVDPMTMLYGFGVGFTVKELREKRKGLVEGAQALLAKIRSGEVKEEQRKEKEAEVDRMLDESDKLNSDIQREERAEKALKDLENPTRDRIVQDPNLSADESENQERYKRAFRTFLVGGLDEMTSEERQILRHGYRADNDKRAGGEKRAQTVTTTGGGYLIPNDWVQAIETAMAQYGSVLEAPTTKFSTDTGALIPYPKVDDTSNKGQLLGINTQESEQALAYDVENFNAYKFTSKSVLVPFELLQDSAFNIDAHLQERLAERLGRILEQYFTTGTGSSQPEGIVNGSFAGYTAAASNAIAYNDLVELKHSVNPAYRKGPAVGWMLADSSLKLIRKLVDSNNRPLWEVSVQAGDPDVILGHRYYINQEMASVEASAKSMLFGNLSKYFIRRVKEMTLMRLTERYADYYQVGFQAWMRADARLVDAGTHPIKHLVHPSP